MFIYLASAKKSRAVPNALMKTKQAVYELPNEPSIHLRNTPTQTYENLGYGKDYLGQKIMSPKKKKYPSCQKN